MIHQIRGSVLSIEPLGAVIEVSGFGIYTSMASTEGLRLGAEVTVLTYLAVKQDGLELYGFTDEADLRFFKLLLDVPGVGPKTALSILKRAPRESLIGAIGTRDMSYLTRVAGLGKKAAEKIVVELAEKVGTGAVPKAGDTEVFEMLVALGYTEREARGAVADIPQEIIGTDARLKAALGSGGR